MPMRNEADEGAKHGSGNVSTSGSTSMAASPSRVAHANSGLVGRGVPSKGAAAEAARLKPDDGKARAAALLAAASSGADVALADAAAAVGRAAVRDVDVEALSRISTDRSSDGGGGDDGGSIDVLDAQVQHAVPHVRYSHLDVGVYIHGSRGDALNTQA